MRDTFSNALVTLAKQDPKVVLLTGDHGYALFDRFRAECPSQYINAGIAEQNMVGMAAGLARAGFRPIVYGLSAFIPVRVLEQIKLDIAHDDLPVILIGDGAGFVYSHLGTSHQCTEDIACARAIPGLSVYSPADRFELAACMNVAFESKAPAYVRMGKADRGDVHSGPIKSMGRGLIQVRRGAPGEMAFVATGALLQTAVEIAESTFPQVSVWSAPVIKPIDESHVAEVCESSSAVVVFEEHSIYGGLGSLIAEVASERAPTRVLRMGVQDRFSEHCGTYNYLLMEHELDRAGIERRLHRFLTTA